MSVKVKFFLASLLLCSACVNGASWNTQMPGGVKLGIKGKIYSFTSDLCSGGIFFKQPVQLDMLCTHGYFLRRPNGCQMTDNDIVSGENYACSKDYKGNRTTKIPVQALIPMTPPELPLGHTITLFNDPNTLKNLRRYSYMKAIQKKYEGKEERGAQGVVIANSHNTRPVNIGKLCYRGLAETRRAAFLANIKRNFNSTGANYGFFTRQCKPASVDFYLDRAKRYPFTEGSSHPDKFKGEKKARVPDLFPDESRSASSSKERSGSAESGKGYTALDFPKDGKDDSDSKENSRVKIDFPSSGDESRTTGSPYVKIDFLDSSGNKENKVLLDFPLKKTDPVDNTYVKIDFPDSSGKKGDKVLIDFPVKKTNPVDDTYVKIDFPESSGKKESKALLDFPVKKTDPVDDTYVKIDFPDSKGEKDDYVKIDFPDRKEEKDDYVKIDFPPKKEDKDDYVKIDFPPNKDNKDDYVKIDFPDSSGNKGKKILLDFPVTGNKDTGAFLDFPEERGIVSNLLLDFPADEKIPDNYVKLDFPDKEVKPVVKKTLLDFPLKTEVGKESGEKDNGYVKIDFPKENTPEPIPPAPTENPPTPSPIPDPSPRPDDGYVAIDFPTEKSKKKDEIVEMYRNSPVKLKPVPILNENLTHWDPYIEESVVLAKYTILKELGHTGGFDFETGKAEGDPVIDFLAVHADTMWYKIIEAASQVVKNLTPPEIINPKFFDEIVKFFGYYFRSLPDIPDELTEDTFKTIMDSLDKCKQSSQKLKATTAGCPPVFDEIEVDLPNGRKEEFNLENLPPVSNSFRSRTNDIVIESAWNFVDVAVSRCFPAFTPDRISEHHRLFVYMKELFLNDKVQRRWFTTPRKVDMYAGLLPFGGSKVVMHNFDKLKAGAHIGTLYSDWIPKPELVVPIYSHTNIKIKSVKKVEVMSHNEDPIIDGTKGIKYVRPFKSKYRKTAAIHWRQKRQVAHEDSGDDDEEEEEGDEEEDSGEEEVASNGRALNSQDDKGSDSALDFPQESSDKEKEGTFLDFPPGSKEEEIVTPTAFKKYEIWDGMAYCLQANYEMTSSDKLIMRGITPSLEELDSMCPVVLEE